MINEIADIILGVSSITKQYTRVTMACDFSGEKTRFAYAIGDNVNIDEAVGFGPRIIIIVSPNETEESATLKAEETFTKICNLYFTQSDDTELPHW